MAVATWLKPKESAMAIAAFCAGGCRSSTSLTPLALMAQERSWLSVWVDGKACDVYIEWKYVCMYVTYMHMYMYCNVLLAFSL